MHSYPKDSSSVPTLLDTNTRADTSSIEICVRDLSYSIVYKPSLFTTSLQHLRQRTDKAIKWIKKTVHQKSPLPLESEPTASHQPPDVTNVGLNIIRHVSMAAKPGQVCLLLGSSGAGKTSLLNILSGRFDPDCAALSGTITYSGNNPKSYWKTDAVGYLDQDDYLQSYLTPRETLEFVANVHTATIGLTAHMRERIESLLLRLGIRDCAERRIGHASDDSNGNGGGGGDITSIGGGGQRGISGGEKRRVSVAIQLLTDPSVLFCDEPTSGLDAFSSFELMKTLTSLAKDTGKTIIVSIHQPRSEIFSLLAENDGQLVLLSLGDVMYSGLISDSLDWFVAAGAGSCPKDMNPFDYMLDISAVDYSSDSHEDFTRKRRQHLVDAWAKRATGTIESSSFTAPSAENMNPDDRSIQEDTTPTRLSKSSSLMGWHSLATLMWTALATAMVHSLLLSKRALLAQVREPAWFVSYIVIHVIVGLWIAYIYYAVESVSLALRARVSLSLAMAAFQPFLSMTVMVYRGSNEIRVFDRERKNRWYGPVPYIISSVVKNFPLACLGTLVYSTIVYYIAALRTDGVSYYLITMLTLVATQFVQCGYILVFTSYFRGFAASSLVAFAFFIAFLLSAGFYVPYYLIPPYYKWVHFASYLSLGYKILVSVEFTDRVFECPFIVDGGRDPDRCDNYLGNVIIEQFNSYPNYYPWPIAFFLIHMSVYMAVSWVILTLKVVEPSAPSSPGSVLDLVYDILLSPFFSSSKMAKQPNNSPTTHPVQINKTILQEKRTSTNDPLTLTLLETSSPVETTADKSNKLLMDFQQQPQNEALHGATRIDIYNKRLDRREPLEIRLENISLSSLTTRWVIAQRQEQHATASTSFFRWMFQRRRQTKMLLQNIHATFPAGELTAILGGSGAGKTSLLNVMLRRSPSNLKAEGDVWFSGSKNPSLRKINSVCGYVRQDDSFLFSHLTVRETLRYAAELSMARSLSVGEKWAKVESIMELMGLLECADVLMGSDESKGCSGGQRRRVSIALQLVIEPSCLILDEPTTGLDAMTALALVRTLKGIAQTAGRTVVCSIHQPRHDIWNEFDNVLLLMSEGRLGYAGKRSEALAYFAQAGHVLPEHTNPADFIVDVASINFQTPEAEASTRQQVDKLARAFAEYRQRKEPINAAAASTATDIANNSDVPPSKENEPSSHGKLPRRPPHYATFWHAFPILTRRSFRNVFRQKSLYFNRLSLPLAISLISSLFFNLHDNTPMGILVRAGFIQQLMVITYNGLLAGACLYPIERDLAFHDLSNGIYGGTSFLFAYMANELPPTVLGAGIMTLVNRAFAMMQWTAFETVVFFLVSIAYVMTGESLAIIFSSWTKNNGITINASIAYVLLYSLMAGVANPNMVQALVNLSYISLWKYGTILLTLIEAKGLQVDCPPELARRNLCVFKTGEQAIRFIRYDKYNLTECFIALAGLTILYRVLAWVSLMARIKKQRWQ